MAGFVQIVEFRTSRIDEVKALADEFGDVRQASTLVHGVVTEDREERGLYRTIVEFPSYEAAMENSGRAETSEFAQRMSALCDGPPSFRNLDVVATLTPQPVS
jgi:hypothetical protein